MSLYLLTYHNIHIYLASWIGNTWCRTMDPVWEGWLRCNRRFWQRSDWSCTYNRHWSWHDRVFIYWNSWSSQKNTMAALGRKCVLNYIVSQTKPVLILSSCIFKYKYTIIDNYYLIIVCDTNIAPFRLVDWLHSDLDQINLVWLVWL